MKDEVLTLCVGGGSAEEYINEIDRFPAEPFVRATGTTTLTLMLNYDRPTKGLSQDKFARMLVSLFVV